MKYLMLILALLTLPAVAGNNEVYVEHADSVTCNIRENLLEYTEKEARSIYEEIYRCKKKFDSKSNRKMTLEIISAEENSITFRTVDPNNDLDDLIMEARKIYGDILR